MSSHIAVVWTSRIGGNHIYITSNDAKNIEGLRQVCLYFVNYFFPACFVFLVGQAIKRINGTADQASGEEEGLLQKKGLQSSGARCFA